MLLIAHSALANSPKNTQTQRMARKACAAGLPDARWWLHAWLRSGCCALYSRVPARFYATMALEDSHRARYGGNALSESGDPGITAL